MFSLYVGLWNIDFFRGKSHALYVQARENLGGRGKLLSPKFKEVISYSLAPWMSWWLHFVLLAPAISAPCPPTLTVRACLRTSLSDYRCFAYFASLVLLVNFVVHVRDLGFVICAFWVLFFLLITIIIYVIILYTRNESGPTLGPFARRLWPSVDFYVVNLHYVDVWHSWMEIIVSKLVLPGATRRQADFYYTPLLPGFPN